jgi:hypothetical protein
LIFRIVILGAGIVFSGKIRDDTRLKGCPMRNTNAMGYRIETPAYAAVTAS